MDFLAKPLDMSKVNIDITFPGVGNRSLTNIIEAGYSATEDTYTMSDPDINGNVITVKNVASKAEIKIKTFIGSDDDVFLAKAEKNATGLGTMSYIDSRTSNKISATGEGVSVQKKAERTANTKDTEIEYTLQCPRFTVQV